MMRFTSSIALLTLATACAHADAGAPPTLAECVESSEANGIPEQLRDDIMVCVLRTHKKDIQDCRDSYSNKDPEVGGTMNTMFTIQPSGEVSDSKVVPDKFEATELGQCLKREVTTWKFPRFSGPAMPLDFAVRKGP